MTKANLTDITILLDKSSSMSATKDRTRSAINEFIQGQRDTNGECNLTLVTFSANDRWDKDWLQTVWDGINIKEIRELADESYRPSGNTALYDAVGLTIERTGQRFAKLPEHERPAKVLFVTMTDGEENSSKEYHLMKIKSIIEHQETKYNWNFLFLGADFNAKENTSSLGLSDDRAYNFGKNDLVKSWKGLSKAVTQYRGTNESKLYSNFADVAKTYADQESN